MEVTPLKAADLEELKPIYNVVPTDWESIGSRTIEGKRGKFYTIIEYVMADGIKVGFFSDQMGKGRDGNFMVQKGHFDSQVKRAREYAKQPKE